MAVPNSNQKRFLRLVAWVAVPQVLLAAGIYAIYFLYHGYTLDPLNISPVDRQAGEQIMRYNLWSMLGGGMVYSMAFAVYGLVYFANRGAIASGKIVGGLILAVVCKYILVVSGSIIAVTYLSAATLTFFAALLANHLFYLIANPIYMSK